MEIPPVLAYGEKISSLIGSTATAWTPLLWLVGIGLVGDSFYFSIPYKPWFYILPSIIFVAFHLPS
jgi:hypothetical protein